MNGGSEGEGGLEGPFIFSLIVLSKTFNTRIPIVQEQLMEGVFPPFTVKNVKKTSDHAKKLPPLNFANIPWSKLHG